MDQCDYGYRAQITARLRTNSLLSISTGSSNKAIEDPGPDFIYYNQSPLKIRTKIDDPTNSISAMINTDKEMHMSLFIFIFSPARPPPLFLSLSTNMLEYEITFSSILK